MLRDATFVGSGEFIGGAAIAQMLRSSLILYDDGTPRTKRLLTNISVDIDESSNVATSRAYLTVMQMVPGAPLQIIVAGSYHDRFDQYRGTWRFVERRVKLDLVGDVSRHLRRNS